MAKGGFKMDWRGAKVGDKAGRAAKRAGIWWGETVVSKAKQRVHRLTGTLSRSLHFRGPQEAGDKFTVEAGSVDWFTRLPYGLYEYRRGGSHDFLTGPAREATGGLRDALKQALAEEGMNLGG